jgi:hypothetical protein
MRTFDHSKKSVKDACGFSEEEFESMFNTVKGIGNDDTLKCSSEKIQRLLEVYKDDPVSVFFAGMMYGHGISEGIRRMGMNSWGRWRK